MSIYGTYLMENSTSIENLVNECMTLANNLCDEKFFESLFEANDEFKEVKDKVKAKDVIIDKVIKFVEEFKIKLNQFIKTALPKMQIFINKKYKDVLLPEIEKHKDTKVSVKITVLDYDAVARFFEICVFEEAIINAKDKEAIDKLRDDFNTNGGFNLGEKLDEPVEDTVNNIYTKYYNKGTIEYLDKLIDGTKLAKSSSELATSISDLKHAKLNNRKGSDEYKETDYKEETDTAIYRSKLLVKAVSVKLRIMNDCYKCINVGLSKLIQAAKEVEKSNSEDK